MGLSGKITAQIDIKCSGDIFYGLFRYRTSNLTKIAPDHIQGCKLHEGEWGAVGSIFDFNYRIDGKAQKSKQIMEVADEKNKSLIFKVFEGDMMQIYKTLKGGLRINKNGENSSVIWTVEYEKINENVPDPDVLIDIASKITKDIETHLLK